MYVCMCVCAPEAAMTQCPVTFSARLHHESCSIVLNLQPGTHCHTAGKFIKPFYNKHTSNRHPQKLRPWLNCDIHWLLQCFCTCRWGRLAHRSEMMCSNVHSYLICITLMRQLPRHRPSKVDCANEHSLPWLKNRNQRKPNKTWHKIYYLAIDNSKTSPSTSLHLKDFQQTCFFPLAEMVCIYTHTGRWREWGRDVG